MEQISLKEHQQIMLNILEALNEFCIKYNLKYFIDAGTLLGAVRHKGFIPWDNDMDVCMLREDYDKFLEIVSKDNDYINDYIKVERPINTMYQFLKLSDMRTTLIEFPKKYPMHTHIYIDIFPKDYLKDNSNETKKLCKKSEMLALKFWFNKYSIHAWKNYKNPIKKVVGFFGRKLIKNPNKPIIKQEKLIREYSMNNPKENCKYLTTLVNGEFHKISLISNFEKQVFLEFENKKFPAPIGYEQYLKDLYGDNYMNIPPENEREIHDIIIYWNNKNE